MISVAFASERKISRWGYDQSTEMVQAVRSSATGDFYVLESLDTSKTVVSRIQGTDRQVVWSKSMILKASFRSLVLNHDDSKLYFMPSYF